MIPVQYYIIFHYSPFWHIVCYNSQQYCPNKGGDHLCGKRRLIVTSMNIQQYLIYHLTFFLTFIKYAYRKDANEKAICQIIKSNDG